MKQRRVVNFTKSGKPVQHGTPAAYTTHGCRCRVCTTGNTEHHARRRRERVEEAAAGTAVFKHGVNGYQNWGCRCEVCASEWAVDCRRRRDDRKARLQDAPHGTESGYIAWGCRCDRCKAAGSAARAERRAKAKETTT